LEGLSGEQMELMDDEALERIIYAEDRLGAMADIFGLRAVAGSWRLPVRCSSSYPCCTSGAGMAQEKSFDPG
jgi:hypothetical protein